MNAASLSELCAEYVILCERIVGLETLPPGYWEQEHEYELDRLYKRKVEITADMRQYWEGQP